MLNSLLPPSCTSPVSSRNFPARLLQLREAIPLDDLDLAREPALAVAAQQTFRPCRVVLAQGADDLPMLLHRLRRLGMGLHPKCKHPRPMRLVPAIGDD